MFAAGITIGLLVVIVLIYRVWVEYLKTRSSHMNVLVTTFSPGQVFLNSLYPGLAIIFLLKSLTPIELTPSENLASLFIIGPLTLWTGYMAWSLGDNSAMKPVNRFLWVITGLMCFVVFVYWGGGTAFHSSEMNEWSNDYIWAYATIGYDVAHQTYNPNAWEGPLVIMMVIWWANLLFIAISVVTYNASFNHFCSSVLQGLGIYQILIIIAMITDNSSLLIALNNMIGHDAEVI